MLRNDKAQKLANKYMMHLGSALAAFGENGIWKFEFHRLYLNEVQEQIDLSEIALHPFTRSRAEQIELEQLKHFFEQKGLQNGIKTVWHKDFYGLLVPFTEQEYPNMKPVKRLV